MPLDSPLDSAMHYVITADTSQVVSQIDRADERIKVLSGDVSTLTNSLTSFEKSGGSFFGGVAKWASTIFGVVEAIVTAPIKLDNFMGVMNTRVTQIGNQLERYRNLMIEIHKTAEGGLAGLSVEDRNKIMAGFVGGATLSEKYGPGAEARAKGFGAGAGMLVRGGFGAEDSAEIMTGLRKQVGLVSAEMEGYSKVLLSINRTSNMTNEEFVKSIKNAIGLARAYGLAGHAGQEFVLQNLRVASAVSQMGLDVEATMKKMNEVATGSEQGLIQSLLMGFQPGQPEAQAAGFQNMAQQIVGMAAGAGQAEPFLIRQLGDVLGLGKFSVEDIKKLAGGVAVEGEGKDTIQKDMLGVLKDMRTEMQKHPELEKESPYWTAINSVNQAASSLTSLLEEEFGQAVKDLKKLLDNVPGWINKIEGWFTDIKKFLGEHDLSLKHVVGGIAGLATAVALIPSAIKLVIAGIPSLFGAGAAGMGGGIGGAGLGAVGGTTAAVSLGSVVGVILLGLAVGGTIGTIIDKITDSVPWMKKAKEKFFDAIVDTTTKTGMTGVEGTLGVPIEDESRGLTTKKTIEELQADKQAKWGTSKLAPATGAASLASEITKAMEIAKGAGFSRFVTTGGAHVGKAHGLGEAVDIGTNMESPEQVVTLKKALAGVSGIKIIDETNRTKGETGGYGKDWSGPHLHVQIAKATGEAVKTAIASVIPTKGGVMIVSDTEAQKTFTSLDRKLARLIELQEKGYQGLPSQAPFFAPSHMNPNSSPGTIVDHWTGVGA
jgi:hypothetical protein